MTTLQTFLTGNRSDEVSCIMLKKRAVTSPLSHLSANSDFQNQSNLNESIMSVTTSMKVPQ